MATRKLLLGGGEKLTVTAEIKRGGGDKKMPYSLEEVRAALTTPLKVVEKKLSTLSREAKPRGEGVFEMTLHPSFLARTYYPSKLLDQVGLRDMGSKEVTIVPRKAIEKRLEGKPHATASIFVAGSEADIQRLSFLLESDRTPDVFKRQLLAIESISWVENGEKLRGTLPDDDASHAFEVALHAGEKEEDIVLSFYKFAQQFNAQVDLKRRIRVGGLTFIPLIATANQLRSLSEFTFLRVARSMPDIRLALPDTTRQLISNKTLLLPTEKALHPTARVAIFDGGLGSTDLVNWATEYTWPETTNTAGKLLVHGSEVTSTFLFGRPQSGKPLSRPFMGVDHYRVLAPTSGKDPDLFDVLLRIKGVLETGQYKFANFSLGPRMPVSDDEVHAWTATLDQLCATYGIFATVAVGNDGNAEGADRIQPPGDMVNALAVGAADSAGTGWKRAPYSCKGPGRSPGYVKPDGVAFGGSEHELFHVYSPMLASTVGVLGTSYSAPLALRAAAGLAATTTFDLPSIALKALMIHHAERKPRLARSDVGWGRFREDCWTLLECQPDSVTVIFKAELAKGEYRRCPIPFPDMVLPSKVKISSTFCISAQTDPEHAVNYTRSGMGIAFRPLHGLGVKDTTEFFGIGSQYKSSERELRDAGHKWETVMHRDRSFEDPSSLAGPVFDVEYHARENSRGVTAASAPDVAFALVITVHAAGVPNLYDLIRTKYPVLQPVDIRTEIEIAT